MTTRPVPFLLALLLGASACVDVEDPELGEEQGELSVWQWTADTDIRTDYSSRQIALATFGDRLHMVHGDNVALGLMWSQFDGRGWTPERIAARSDSSPALAVHDNRLQLIFKPAGEGRLMKMETAGTTWSTPVTVGRSLGTYVPSAPAAFSEFGLLYIAYCARSGSTSRVFIDRLVAGTWRAVHDFEVSSTSAYACQSVAFAPAWNRVEIFYNTVSTTGTKNSVVGRKWILSGGALDLSPVEILPMKSTRPLSVATCGSLGHLIHGGFSRPTEIWWSPREATGWSSDLKIPNKTAAGAAAVGCLGSTAVLVHNTAGSNGLQWSVFGP